MLKPYDLPFLPIEFDAETELQFYKKIVTASTVIERLNQKLHYSPVNKSFLQLFSLNESVQSTKIEGSQVTFSDMLEEQIEEKKNWERVEVNNYRKALDLGIETIQNGYPLTERLIRDMHRTLMENARGSTTEAGNYRKTQNFIGPTNDIKDALYIPPEAQKLGDYMTNLERYMNGHPYIENTKDPLHPLIKTAIVHAQFESIHPFQDGNGRLGRILIALCLLQEKVTNTVLFLSEELEKERYKYYALLNGVRAIKGKRADWKSWINFFLDAAIRMAENQYTKLEQAEELFNNGLTQISQPSVKKIWAVFFMQPITTVAEIEKITDLAPSTIRKGLKQMEEGQMIFGNEYRRNRRYYLYDLIRIMSE